ncbi:hypothetical protein ACVWXU_004524 [Streptomyces sp. TE33382]
MALLPQRYRSRFLPAVGRAGRHEEVQAGFWASRIKNDWADRYTAVVEELDRASADDLSGAYCVPPLARRAQLGSLAYGHPSRRQGRKTWAGIGHEKGLLATISEETIPFS